MLTVRVYVYILSAQMFIYKILLHVRASVDTLMLLVVRHFYGGLAEPGYCYGLENRWLPDEGSGGSNPSASAI